MPHLKYNNTSFKRGRKKTGGRKAGVRNKATKQMDEKTRDILYMVKQAADRIGSDGAGKDGMLGYLKFLALNDTPAFVKLIGRVLQQEFKDERVKVAGHTH